MADAQAALDRALADDNLVLLYQPIHDTRTHRIVAAEALLRQRRESGEIREAAIITAAAEEAPAVDLYALDSWTIRNAYQGAARWFEAGAENIRLNVNLSPREFEEGDVVRRLTDLLTQCGIGAGQVNLEITETSYIAHPEETVGVLDELKALGVSLWLDDFGTKHSSIIHLLRFPIDGIKIPADFVRGIERDKKSRAIVSGLLAVAADAGVEVIAEGVERQAQLDYLAEHGCGSIQGFLFTRPMTLESLIQLAAPHR